MYSQLKQNIICSLMNVFGLKPNKNYTYQDCTKIVMPPILMYDVATEEFYNIQSKLLRHEEKSNFNTIKHHLMTIESHLYDNLNMNEKEQLSNEMSKFIDYIKTDVDSLKKEFYNFLGDNYQEENRKLITQFYVISTLCQCVSLYLMKLKKNHVLLDYLTNIAFRIEKIQTLIAKRDSKCDTIFNPNIDKNITEKIEIVINSMFSYI